MLTLGLVWSTCSLRRVVATSLERLSGQVLGALPPGTPASTREALHAKLRCAVDAAAQRRVGEWAVGELARACREALADSRVSDQEMAAIFAAAERVCPRTEGGP